MSADFKRLYSLAGNLYAEGSPLLIEAGALLLHNESGRVLAQLKLKNIDSHRIKAAKVRFIAYDTAGKALDEVVEYEYLDINAVRDECFGEQNAVFFSKRSVRAYDAMPFWVCFDDGSEWFGSDEKWESLPQPEELKSSLGDGELVKQYGIKYGLGCKNLPLEVKDLWYCSCGGINHAAEARCNVCGRELACLLDFKLEELRCDCDERLEQERIEAEMAKAEAEAKKAEIAKKTKKILPIAMPAIIAVVALAVLTFKVFIPSANYNKAEKLLEAGEGEQAAVIYEKLGDYKDSQTKAKYALNAEKYINAYKKAEKLLAKGDKAGAAMAFGSAGTYKDAWERSKELWAEIAPYPDNISTVVASGHTVALFEDGTMAAIGSRGKYDFGQFDIEDWKDIVAIAANGGYTLGLKSDGTVLATGHNEYGQLDVADWEDVVWIDTGDNLNNDTIYYQTIGIRADGRMYAVGYNKQGQCEVDDWDGIVAASSSGCYVLGLRADGTVLAAGDNSKGQCNVQKWSNIISIDTGDWETSVGLRADGTAVATGNNSYGQCDIDDWTGLVALSVGGGHTVGLKADGTVCSAGLTPSDEYSTDDWENIIAISAGTVHTVGLKADGTVLATGMNDVGQCDVDDWTDVIAIDTYDGNTVGLRADGTVLMVGYNGGGQCEVDDWENVMLPEYFKTER